MNTIATATGPADTPKIGPLRAWVLHLWAFVLPSINAAFLWFGPYRWWQALLWTGVIWTLVYIDVKAPNDQRQPPDSMPSWPFDLQIYALTALQLLNYVLVAVVGARLATQVHSAWDLGPVFANLVGVMVVSGTTAGYTGIVVAHEWVHRRSWHQQLLGRVLLMGVLYEHFATEHVRGHHPRLGTSVDPATARFGESFKDFFRRTVPAQFKSAWQLEKKRLGNPTWRAGDPRWLSHRTVQGLLGEAVLLAALYHFFGVLGVVFFLMQARSAVMLLETVNYIEHWGIQRATKKVMPVDSWDTDNWFTLHTLVGLSRHADHHAQASRPYQQLRHFDETAKMPTGYYGTILLALTKNERYQELASAELRRRKLGPFRAAAEQQQQASPAGLSESQGGLLGGADAPLPAE